MVKVLWALGRLLHAIVQGQIMAHLPTPEENAMQILNIFVNHFNGRPGSVLRLVNFLAVMDKYDMRADDLTSGFIFASNAGWVDIPSDKTYRLTQDGFAAA